MEGLVNPPWNPKNTSRSTLHLGNLGWLFQCNGVFRSAMNGLKFARYGKAVEHRKNIP